MRDGFGIKIHFCEGEDEVSMEVVTRMETTSFGGVGSGHVGSSIWIRILGSACGVDGYCWVDKKKLGCNL